MMHKAAILGCGPRARAHVEAYGALTRARVVAACTRNVQKLHPFCDDLGIPARFTDLRAMLEREAPDLLHIVTGPRVRHDVMKLASDLGVPLVIVEKPIALDGGDWKRVAALADTSRTRFVVNTQLHFHPRNLDLKRDVSSGRIGDVRFIEASARSTAVNQGPHILQLVSSYLEGAAPHRVFGQVGGAENLREGPEPSPDDAVASITYANGVRAAVAFGEKAGPRASNRDSRFLHKQIAVYGSRGFVRWTMYSWERFTPDSGYEHGEHDYAEQDAAAQCGLTEAAVGWLEDPARTHPTNLHQSLAEFNVLLGLYASALRHEPIDLPFDPPADLLERLRDRIDQGA